jgi:3-phenylpropionate/cinnamic acid dioxygenase small subunit
MLSNQNNFDWSCTNKELIIFIPNFGRKHLLIPTLKRFRTEVPNNRWCWVICNDRVHEDLSDLEQYNLKWFTFEHSNKNEINGCLLRNFFIKRCQSKWLMTKDPEIVIDDDIVSKVIDLDDIVYRPGGMIELCPQETQQIIDNPLVDLKSFPILRQWKVNPNNYEGFHNCVTIRTQRLKDMGGYEEEFKDGYGYEDVNILERLKISDVKIIIDNGIVTYHINHPIIRNFHKTIIGNEKIYRRLKQNLQIIANKNKEWGEHLGG